MNSTHQKISFVLITAMMTISCGSKKNIAQIHNDEVMRNLPCTEAGFFSNGLFFRATAIGESHDKTSARIKAFAAASHLLATNIKNTMKIAIDNYAKANEINNMAEVKENFKDVARNVVNRKLNTISEICEKETKSSYTYTYKYSITIEISVNDIKSDLLKTLSQEQSLKEVYNYDKFKEAFEQEMSSLSGKLS
jgi:hypothetical protein